MFVGNGEQTKDKQKLSILTDDSGYYHYYWIHLHKRKNINEQVYKECARNRTSTKSKCE